MSIIECDMDVDFAPPLGYVEPTYAKNHQKQSEENEAKIKYPIKKEVKVGGEGYRLDGKAIKPEQLISSQKQDEMEALKNTEQRGIPNYDYTIGPLTFNRNLSKKEEVSFFFFIKIKSNR